MFQSNDTLLQKLNLFRLKNYQLTISLKKEKVHAKAFTELYKQSL